MKCRNFERAWNELIDAEAGGGVEKTTLKTIPRQRSHWAAETERALQVHAAECPACRQVAARYQVLQRAIREWGPPPAPPAGLADRILANLEAPMPSGWAIYGSVNPRPNWTIFKTMAGVAAAGVLVGLALPAINRAIDRKRLNDPQVVMHNTPTDPHETKRPVPPAADARALNVALAEATAATWDLARTASAPAARISRQVLDAASEPKRNAPQVGSGTGSKAGLTTASVPSLETLAPEATTAGAMLQQVGDRLTSGVRPLSDTARHAFGFLLGPPVPKPEVPTNPPAQKGA